MFDALKPTKRSSTLQANLPTPWVGVWERILIGAFMLWVVVLAVTVLRLRDAATSDAGRGSTSGR
jgi:hypothetical protein